MSKQSLKNELLWDAADDWYGLWEALWQVKTESPELPEPNALEAARAAVKALLLDGLIYLCWFDQDANSEIGVMSSEEALKVVSRDESWEPVASFATGQIRYSATDKGIRASRKGPVSS